MRKSAFADPALVLFACLFTSQSALLVLSPILVDVAREFGVSTAAAGQGAAALAVGVCGSASA
jgi:predicted MFS family arabinose efflux permease